MKRLYSILFFCVFTTVYGQLNQDIAQFNYSIYTMSKDEISMARKGVNVNLPMRLKKGVLIHSVSADYFKFLYDNPSFYASDLEHFYRFNYSVSYMYPMASDWRLLTRAGVNVASNFTENLSLDDVNFMGSIGAIKTYKRNENVSRLMFGVGYLTLTGSPQIIPIFRYYHEINRYWSYAIGFPESFLKYKFNEIHEISLGARMDGFYANLSRPLLIEANDVATAASFRTGLTGLTYSFKIDNIWRVFFKTEYAFYNQYDLMNSNSDSVYDYELSANMNISVGVKLSLINNFKKKNNDKD